MMSNNNLKGTEYEVKSSSLVTSQLMPFESVHNGLISPDIIGIPRASKTTPGWPTSRKLCKSLDISYNLFVLTD